MKSCRIGSYSSAHGRHWYCALVVEVEEIDWQRRWWFLCSGWEALYTTCWGPLGVMRGVLNVPFSIPGDCFLKWGSKVRSTSDRFRYKNSSYFCSKKNYSSGGVWLQRLKMLSACTTISKLKFHFIWFLMHYCKKKHFLRLFSSPCPF